MFNKILVANRGEIAVRIIRACRELGIETAAIYSDADIKSLHTRLADKAYYIGSSTSSESYLNKNKILNLAVKIKADAVHPGYGFFSENGDFIDALDKRNIAFIGPSAKSVWLMGSKTAARQLMAKHNVPIVPGTTEPIAAVEEGIKAAEKIGYPILLKASAGGGGKGMRRVYSNEEFINALEATKREALKAFGSDDIYIEKYIENPRHIEVQVIADKFGSYVHLFERECSIQRRHQKIIEESPSSFVDEITRKKITQAAINAARACGYYNAGTIEFLMDVNKNFYFLEMNTRLQVEHPVTELISGVDLVKEQISIAAENKLSFRQEDLKITGHAIESRIYAEDSENNFLPSTGTLTEYRPPYGAGVRVDSGFDRGSEISVYYDPLISKLICYSSTRAGAIEKMKSSLEEYRISGVITNIPFLRKIFNHQRFITGEIDINFIESELLNKNLDMKNDFEEVENIAAIFSALLKTVSSSKINSKESSVISNNEWSSLLYE